MGVGRGRAGVWGEEEAHPSHTDQNSPSSILCSSCFRMPGDTSSHSLALKQRQVRGRGRGCRSGGTSFLPKTFPHPECLPTGVPGSAGESRGEESNLVHPWVPLWHGLAHGPAVCSASHLGRGTYLSLQAPFHSIRPQGFRTRISVSVLPRYQTWVGCAVKVRSKGAGGSALPSHAPQGQGQLSDSHPEVQSLSKHVLSPASSGSRIPSHCRW